MRTIWIVDSAYLSKGAAGLFDYLKLKQALEARIGTAFAASYYFDCLGTLPTETRTAFHNWLKQAAPRGPHMRLKLYGLKTKRLICHDCGRQIVQPTQKGLDVGIATLMIRLAIEGAYERLVLCAGDGDLEDALAYVTDELGKEVHLAGFDGSVSADLQAHARSVIWLDQCWEQFGRHAVGSVAPQGSEHVRSSSASSWRPGFGVMAEAFRAALQRG